jgi:hypothetical protein
MVHLKNYHCGAESLQDSAEQVYLDSLLKDLDCDTQRTLRWGKETGQWLSVMLSTLNGTELSPQEFWDSLHLCYVRTPGDLPTHCNGCDTKFSIRHALKCKVGGLIIM